MGIYLTPPTPTCSVGRWLRIFLKQLWTLSVALPRTRRVETTCVLSAGRAGLSVRDATVGAAGRQAECVGCAASVGIKRRSRRGATFRTALFPSPFCLWGG